MNRSTLEDVEPSMAQTMSTDPLGCDETVFDPDGVLNLNEIEPYIRSTESALDADIRVRAERTLDGGLDARIDQLTRQCDGWSSADGELADGMIIVFFSPVERENSIVFGAGLDPAVEQRADSATDSMIPELQAGDYDRAVQVGLRGLTTSSSTSSSSSSTSDSGSGGSDNGTVVLAIVVIVAVVVVSWISKRAGWSSGGSYDDGDEGLGSLSGSGRRRRRSFGSFRPSSRSGSSSRTSSSGSRRSGRAGRSTKKW